MLNTVSEHLFNKCRLGSRRHIKELVQKAQGTSWNISVRVVSPFVTRRWVRPSRSRGARRPSWRRGSRCRGRPSPSRSRRSNQTSAGQLPFDDVTFDRSFWTAAPLSAGQPRRRSRTAPYRRRTRMPPGRARASGRSSGRRRWPAASSRPRRLQIGCPQSGSARPTWGQRVPVRVDDSRANGRAHVPGTAPQQRRMAAPSGERPSACPRRRRRGRRTTAPTGCPR